MVRGRSAAATATTDNSGIIECSNSSSDDVGSRADVTVDVLIRVDQQCSEEGRDA